MSNEIHLEELINIMENKYISYSCLNDRHNECLYKYQIVRKQTLYGDEFSEYIL